MDIAEAVRIDRERRKAEGSRRQLSRKKYGELVGLGEQRVWAIEQGKRLKAGELDALRKFVGDLIEDNGGRLPDSVKLEPDQERAGLSAAYAYLQTRLEGKPAPPHLATEVTLTDKTPPESFPAIRAWIQSMHEWLDGVRPEEEVPATEDLVFEFDYDSAPPLDESESEPAPVEVYPEPEIEKNASNQSGGSIDPEPEVDVIDRLKAYAVKEEPRPLPPPVEFEDGLRYVTNSELKTFKRCRRKWWLDYVRKVKPKRVEVTGAASVGTRVHRILSEYYVPQGAKRRDPWQVFDETIEQDALVLDSMDAPEEMRRKWRSEVDLARAMIEGYLDWVEETAADAGIEIMAPEMRLVADPKFPDLESVRLLAKLDVRANRTLDGARLFIDHKTVMDFVTPQKTLHLDEQMLHYHLTEYLDLMASGNAESRTDGAIYNMLRKVKRSAAAKPPFYARVEVRHNLDELRNYWLRVMQTVKDMEAARLAVEQGMDPIQVMYPNPTRDCTWQCPHLAVCSMFDDGGYAEDYISDNYVGVNPLQRYENEEVPA